MQMEENAKTLQEAAAKWTNGGEEVYVLRFVEQDGSSRNGFRYPLTVGAAAECPDWDAKPVCGNGLHGWPWALGIGDGKDPEWAKTWLVIGCKPEDVVCVQDCGTPTGKVKFRAGVVRFVGAWDKAAEFCLSGQIALVQRHSDGKSSATGYRSASSATGDRSASSATGYRSASSATGDRSASSATGYRSASSATGYRSASSATGDSSASSATGDSSAAVCTGLNGKAKAGLFGCIALAWWNAKEQRAEMRCALTGCAGGLKADTWYRLDERGEFVEAG